MEPEPNDGDLDLQIDRTPAGPDRNVDRGHPGGDCDARRPRPRPRCQDGPARPGPGAARRCLRRDRSLAACLARFGRGALPQGAARLEATGPGHRARRARPGPRARPSHQGHGRAARTGPGPVQPVGAGRTLPTRGLRVESNGRSRGRRRPGADLPRDVPHQRSRRGDRPLAPRGPRRRAALRAADRGGKAPVQGRRCPDRQLSRSPSPRPEPRFGTARAGRGAPPRPPHHRGGRGIRGLHRPQARRPARLPRRGPERHRDG